MNCIISDEFYNNKFFKLFLAMPEPCAYIHYDDFCSILKEFCSEITELDWIYDVVCNECVIRCELGENNQFQSTFFWTDIEFEDPIIQIKFGIHFDLIEKVSMVMDQEVKRLYKLYGPPSSYW